MSILLPEHKLFIRNLPERHQSFVVGNLLLYLFRGCHQADIRTRFQEKKIQFDFLGWRRHLHHNGLLLRDGKLYVYAKSAKRSIDLTSYDLCDESLDLLDIGMKHRPLIAHLKELQKIDFCRVMSPRLFDRFVNYVLSSEDLTVYTRKFINHKMSFIKKSYNLHLDDIEHTLKANALYGLQRAYPRFEHTGHGIAIAKTVIKRTGQNFIDHMTTQKQNALIHDESNDTYSKTTVSLDSIADGTGQFLTEDGTYIHRSLLIVGISGSNSWNQIPMDTLHSLRELCHSSKLKMKQREFLNLMMGNYAEEFSKFLGVENNTALETLPYNAYMNKVCDFLSIPMDSALKFLKNLAPQLGGSMVW